MRRDHCIRIRRRRSPSRSGCADAATIPAAVIQTNPAQGRAFGRRDNAREYGNLRPRSRATIRRVRPPPINREITVSEGITVRRLSEKLGRQGQSRDSNASSSEVFAVIDVRPMMVTTADNEASRSSFDPRV